MKLLSMLSLCLFVVAMTMPAARAGALAPELERQIANRPGDDLIKVWIKLPEPRGLERLGAVLQEQAATRAGRHTLGLARLRAEHDGAQASLLGRLRELQAADKADNVHGYWIVNVVEAQVAAASLRALAERPDVQIIQPVPQIYLIEPDRPNSPGGALGTDSVQSNLAYIKADQAWAMGYTGSGRLVCSFDTGIDGDHDALFSNWKGHDGDSAAAWFDPIFGESFPHTQPVSPNHGTHVMGIMVGHDDVAGDTTGVAPGARWIAAAVVDVGATVILRAFEWAADPDGNPNTVDDVPDVINHSWGFDRIDWSIDCQDIFSDAIDNTEALGIVNIFAAGNSGLFGTQTITNPANRANDILDCFAVGNLKHLVDSIAPNSSRGPSDCNGAVKPNVVAPGFEIRSTKASNTYGKMSGTSMATPHVSGLVALLRQKNPNATVNEIKQAILSSATSHPNFGTLPNNNFGWGAIDCPAALDSLDGPEVSANVRVYDFDYPPISPGDTVAGAVVLECLGAAVTNVSAAITGSQPSLTVLNASAFFGNMSPRDTVRSADSIRAVVSDTVTPGQILSIDFLISGTDLTVPARLHFLVGPPAGKSVVTHNTGRIEFSLSNFGVYGFGPVSYVPGPGAGFRFDGGTNELYEGGLIVGDDYTRVSSGVHTYIFEPENDFRVAAGGDLVFTSPGPLATEQTYSIFNDSNAANPLGLEIIQESFASTGGNSDIIVMRYILQNRSGSALSGVYTGLYLNWDAAGIYTQSVGGYEADKEFAWIAYYNGGSPRDYRGAKLLEGPPATALTEKESFVVIPAFDGDGFVMWEKYQALTDGFGTANTYRNSPNALFQLVAAGPLDFEPGGSDTVTFALLAGNSFADISGAAARTDSVVITDVPFSGDKPLPRTFVLHQNHPNPFNPATVILFDLPRASEYRLTIFNTLGQIVHEETGRAGVGRVSIEWNAEAYGSGIYFYRVEAGEHSATKKMMLLK
ncbi:MAG TPA: S8 family serine peptidase [Acidobacteriota bacterium]|nr:S8 family serine peptidase [Acidobacteriota bacterium]